MLDPRELTWPPVDGSKQPCPRCHGDRYEAEPVDDVGDPFMRCYDCFGDGWQGGGACSMYANRQLALLVACPKCSAAEGDPCIGKANRFFTPGQTCHSDRHRASVAQLQFRDSVPRRRFDDVAVILGDGSSSAALAGYLP